MAETMREYQTILIVNPELKPEAQEQFQGQFGEQVARLGGRVIESVVLGRRRLSYKMGRHVEGNYLQAKIEIPTLQVESLKESVSRMEPVIRMMVVLTTGAAAPLLGAAPASEAESEE